MKTGDEGRANDTGPKPCVGIGTGVGKPSIGAIQAGG